MRDTHYSIALDATSDFSSLAQNTTSNLQCNSNPFISKCVTGLSCRKRRKPME